MKRRRRFLGPLRRHPRYPRAQLAVTPRVGAGPLGWNRADM